MAKRHLPLLTFLMCHPEACVQKSWVRAHDVEMIFIKMNSQSLSANQKRRLFFAWYALSPVAQRRVV